MTTDIILLGIGVIFFLLGLGGQIKSQWLEAGLTNRLSRALVGTVGAAFMGIGLFIMWEPKCGEGDSLQVAPSHFKTWSATRNEFVAEVKTDDLREYGDEFKNMVLICRKHRSSVPFDQDREIAKSHLFQIPKHESETTLAIEFKPEFSESLDPGNIVQCAGALLLEGTTEENIVRLADIETPLGGIVFGRVYNTLCAVGIGGKLLKRSPGDVEGGKAPLSRKGGGP